MRCGSLGRRCTGNPGRACRASQPAAEIQAQGARRGPDLWRRPSVVASYQALGARLAQPIYNALDPDTHHPVPPDPRYRAHLVFLGNRLPDREARVEEFFIKPARSAPQFSFLLGGAGWEGKGLPSNVRLLGHVPTRDHNALNASANAVLNINRASMAANGYSPATRIFEAAGRQAASSPTPLTASKAFSSLARRC